MQTSQTRNTARSAKPFRHTLALLSCVLMTSTALAEDADKTAAYPSRPVTMVVPFPAGGNLDIFARSLGQSLSDRWEVPVVIDNRPGGGGVIGAQRVINARPDGYTLLFTNTSVIQTPALAEKAPYDPIKDLAPVTQLGTVAVALAIRSSAPVKTIGEYMARLKAEPGKHVYATYGTGSSAHLLMEGLKARENINVTHVPYKGEGPAMQDLLANQIEAGVFSERLTALQQKEGNVVPLAVTGTLRSELLPDTPTFLEAGIEGMDIVGWFGVLAPAGTPLDITRKLAADFKLVLAEPAMQQRLRDLVIRPTGNTPEEFGRLLVKENEIWKGLIERFNVGSR